MRGQGQEKDSSDGIGMERKGIRRHELGSGGLDKLER